MENPSGQRGAWRGTVHGESQELDTTKLLTQTIINTSHLNFSMPTTVAGRQFSSGLRAGNSCDNDAGDQKGIGKRQIRMLQDLIARESHVLSVLLNCGFGDS